MKDSFVGRLAACYILLSILPFMAIFSQNAASGDFFEKGRQYKFIYTDNKLPPSNNPIELRNKYKVVLSFGAGVALLTTSESISSHNFEPKSTYHLLALVTLGEFTGLRLDVGYSSWLREKYSVYGFDTLKHLVGYDFYEEQTKSFYYIKSDFVWGNFSSKDNFWFYFTAGFGMNFVSYRSFLYKNISEDYYGWYYREMIYNYPAQTSTGGVISIGGALGYRFTKHFGCYSDIQFNESANTGYSFFGMNATTFIPVRAGITYTIY